VGQNAPTTLCSEHQQGDPASHAEPEEETGSNPDRKPSGGRKAAAGLAQFVNRQLTDFVDIANNCTGHISLSFITDFPLATTACGESESGDGMFLCDVAIRVGE